MPSINYQKLGQFFSENKLWDTPFREFDETDIERLAEAVADAVEDFGACWEPPCIYGGKLHIPWNAPKKYRWWQGGQTIMATLEELGAEEEVKAKYRHHEGVKKND